MDSPVKRYLVAYNSWDAVRALRVNVGNYDSKIFYPKEVICELSKILRKFSILKSETNKMVKILEKF